MVYKKKDIGGILSELWHDINDLNKSTNKNVKKNNAHIICTCKNTQTVHW